MKEWLIELAGHMAGRVLAAAIGAGLAAMVAAGWLVAEDVCPLVAAPPASLSK